MLPTMKSLEQASRTKKLLHVLRKNEKTDLKIWKFIRESGMCTQICVYVSNYETRHQSLMHRVIQKSTESIGTIPNHTECFSQDKH